MKRKFKQVMKQKSKIKAANFAKMKVSKNKKIHQQSSLLVKVIRLRRAVAKATIACR